MSDFRELLCRWFLRARFDRSISYIFLPNKKYWRNVRFYFSEFIARVRICRRHKNIIGLNRLSGPLSRTARYFSAFLPSHFLLPPEENSAFSKSLHICIKRRVLKDVAYRPRFTYRLKKKKKNRSRALPDALRRVKKERLSVNCSHLMKYLIKL